jgi:hypothetical protein
MKTICLTTMIAVFMLLCSIGILAQTNQTQLNQLELVKQFIGNWKMESGKDTTWFLEYKLFGTGMEEYYKSVTKGKIISSEKGIWGYDKEKDKNIHAQLWEPSSVVDINVFWFTSKNICEGVEYKDLSNPENASLKWKLEFKSPDLMVMTTTINGKVVSTSTITREKK